MPVQFGLSRQDVLTGKPIDPGWVPVAIKRVEETKAGATAKNPGSTLVVIHCTVTSGKFKDYPLKFQFSEVSPGFAVPFWNALLPADKQIKDTDENPVMPPFDDKLIKAELEVEIENSMYNGRMQNNVKDYRPLQKRR